MKQFIGLLAILLCLYLLDSANTTSGKQQEITLEYDQYETDCINYQNELDSSNLLKINLCK